MPAELEREVVVLDFPLPTRDELRSILGGLEESTGVKAENEDMVLDAAQGLTWEEAENALALALVRQKCFDPKTITELKAQMVKKSAALEFSQFKETFETLGGLENLKDWTLNRFKSRRPGLPFRGILLLGVPGTGKSHFAKALGNQVGWPCLSLNLGKVFGSLVGESEAKMRDALKVVDAMAPCILFLDEIEKGLAGVGGGSTDGGTTQRVGGTFLTWLNDHTSEVFVIATCNDYAKLPPEYTRMGRWDAIFFVDNPGPGEREEILDIYRHQFEVDLAFPYPNLDGYSGAEIRQVAIEAAYNGGDLDGRGPVRHPHFPVPERPDGPAAGNGPGPGPSRPASRSWKRSRARGGCSYDGRGDQRRNPANHRGSGPDKPSEMGMAHNHRQGKGPA